MKLILFMSIFLIACDPVYPVPENAVKTCLDKNWEVEYSSTGENETRFKCKKSKKGRW